MREVMEVPFPGHHALPQYYTHHGTEGVATLEKSIHELDPSPDRLRNLFKLLISDDPSKKVSSLGTSALWVSAWGSF